jgi:hypothetical protein
VVSNRLKSSHVGVYQIFWLSGATAVARSRRHIFDAVGRKKPAPFGSKGNPRHCECEVQVQPDFDVSFIRFAGSVLIQDNAKDIRIETAANA